MGKSEILMLLAGVALSVMLAMIAVPMFSSGNEMADRQQVQQDLMSIKSSIPLILALEGDNDGNFKTANIKKHITGFEETTVANTIKNTKTGSDASYAIVDNGKTTGTITITVTTTAKTGVDLEKLTRLDSICDGGAVVDGKITPPTVSTNTLTCIMKRK